MALVPTLLDTGRRVAVVGGGEVSCPEIAPRLTEPCELPILGGLEVGGIGWKDGYWHEMACDTVMLAKDAAPDPEMADLLGASFA